MPQKRVEAQRICKPIFSRSKRNLVICHRKLPSNRTFLLRDAWYRESLRWFCCYSYRFASFIGYENLNVFSRPRPSMEECVSNHSRDWNLDVSRMYRVFWKLLFSFLNEKVRFFFKKDAHEWYREIFSHDLPSRRQRWRSRTQYSVHGCTVFLSMDFWKKIEGIDSNYLSFNVEFFHFAEKSELKN